MSASLARLNAFRRASFVTVADSAPFGIVLTQNQIYFDFVFLNISDSEELTKAIGIGSIRV